MKSILLTSFLLLQVLCGYSQIAADENTNTTSKENGSSFKTSEKLAVAPSYLRGGDEAFLQFISKNIEYPGAARSNKTQGKVTVRFQVDEKGNVKNAKVPDGMGIGNGCDEEAVRVVMLSPKWRPGTRLGVPSAMWYEVPVVFALNEVK